MLTVLFDIDGTLLLTGGAGQRAMERALGSVFGVTRPTEDIPAAGRTDHAITTDLFAYHGIEDHPANRRAFQRQYVEHLAEALPRLTGRILPGVRELLDVLSGRNDVLVGLLTGNFEEGAWLKLRHYDLDRHFCCGGFGDTHAHRDDVARAALAAANRYRQADVPAGSVWVVGDTPSDIACARAIGARVLAVSTGMYPGEHLWPHAPDVLFPDLSDTSAVLSLWFGR
jgi:phosphoglycolate phosphatase